MNDASEAGPDDWILRKQHLVMQPFALALARSAVPTVLCDAALEDQPIVFANASFLRMTGCAEAEVLGRNLRFFLALDADPDIVRKVEKAVDAVEGVSADLHMRRADGREFWARMELAPVFGPDRQARMFVATVVDVSDRVRAVRSLRAAEESFERRVEARTAALESALARTDLLSREVSHRTKNSLAILGALVEAKRRRARDPAVAEALAEISGHVRAMSRLQGLLEGMGRDADRVGLGDVLSALVEELGASAGGRVILGDAPEAPLASEAALALALCVTELVLNAQKHGFGDGREGVVIVEAQSELDGLAVSVSDNGRGLPDAFDPAASSGLGMLVVLDQVGRLGGVLEVGPSPSGGALFRVRLPG